MNRKGELNFEFLTRLNIANDVSKLKCHTITKSYGLFKQF